MLCRTCMLWGKSEDGGLPGGCWLSPSEPVKTVGEWAGITGNGETWMDSGVFLEEQPIKHWWIMHNIWEKENK